MTSIKSSHLGIAVICNLLALGLSSLAMGQAKHSRLEVSDIAGYYIADSKNAVHQTLSVFLLGKTSKGDEPEQCNFTGQYGDSTFVGQGVTNGGTDDGRLPDNVIQFDFMVIDRLDGTLLTHSMSTMSRGHIVGLNIKVDGSSNDNEAVRYRRVSRAQFLLFRRNHS